MIRIKCEICNSPFNTKPSLQRIGKGRFCSRACADRWQSIFKKVPDSHERRKRDLNRFFHFVVKPSYWRETGACWFWKGYINTKGYPIFSVNQKPLRAHRFSYTQHKGPIPNNLELDHLCRNRWCVNPEHLEAITHRENLLRGIRCRLTSG